MSDKNSQNQKLSIISTIDDKVKFITKNVIFYLVIIGSIGFFIRFYYFPFDIPLTLDGLDIFAFSVKTGQLGHFPKGWLLANNGWPTFLSFFFYIFKFDNFFDYVYLQRFLAVILSVLTIVPVYFLCTRFFSKSYSLFGAALFTFEPRLTLNSLAGITEPLFILLGTIALFLFLSKDQKLVFVSFCVTALFALVRFEGLLLFVPFSIIFFIRFRKQKNIVLKYLLAITIFALTLLPMEIIAMQVTGEEILFNQLIAGPRYISDHIIPGYSSDEPWIKEGQNNILDFIVRGLIGLVENIVLTMIPLFMFFVPISIFFYFKDRKFKKNDYQLTTLILTTIALLVSAFYAYGRNLDEPRYLFSIFPIFCVLSLYFIRKIQTKFKAENLILILLIGGTISVSILFLNYQTAGYDHEKDAFLITQKVVRLANGTNYFNPESRYVKAAEISKNWPMIPPPDQHGHITREMSLLSEDGFESLEIFIKNSKEYGLTHLVLDGREDRTNFFNDVFYNDEKYPYLEKIYDSLEEGLKYHVKIYEINYGLFEGSDR